jgi:hypothetical protein
VLGQDRSDKDHFVESLVGLPFLGKNINSNRTLEITLLNDESKKQIEGYIEGKKKPLTLTQITDYIEKGEQ